MVWTGARKLLLPAALTVTTFAAVGVVVACGGDDDDTGSSSQNVGACAEAPAGACELCKDDNGKVTCGPAKDCYIDVNKECHYGSNS